VLATLEVGFAADHAAARGHFPDNPIIPGALLLSETLRAIETSLGKNLCPYQIRSAKFIRPVRPGERVSIDFSWRDEKRISFSCKVEAAPVLAGEVVCGPDSVER
jgi:3-hydroxymyristoyl/3-hydroxydecanoyl-(acyl carrier protein) dehydratase